MRPRKNRQAGCDAFRLFFYRLFLPSFFLCNILFHGIMENFAFCTSRLRVFFAPVRTMDEGLAAPVGIIPKKLTV